MLPLKTNQFCYVCYLLYEPIFLQPLFVKYCQFVWIGESTLLVTDVLLFWGLNMNIILQLFL